MLITHDVEEAIHLADRIMVLSPRPTRIQARFNVDLPLPELARQERHHQLHLGPFGLVVLEVRTASLVVPEARTTGTEQVGDQVDFRPPSGHPGYLGGHPCDVVEQHRGIVPRSTDNRPWRGRLAGVVPRGPPEAATVSNAVDH